MNELVEFTKITTALSSIYPKLMNYAAIEAVNYFKDNIRRGVDIYGVPFAPRKAGWVARKRDKGKAAGRGILIDKGVLIRDIQKIYVDATSAVVGTTRISSPYAKAHNEGFKGAVTQKVEPHTRRRWKQVNKATGIYSVKTKKQRFKKVKELDKTIQVKAFTRRIQQDITQRQYMGNSPILDAKIDDVITNKIVETIAKNSRQITN